MSSKPANENLAAADSQPAPIGPEHTLPPGRILINRRQLRQKVPLCDRTILEMEKRGQFPRRFLAGHKVHWNLHEVDAWIAGQHEAGIQARRPGE